MAYPHNQLGAAEQVLIHEHPHWKVLLLPLAGAAVVAAGCVYLAALVADQPFRQVAWIALAAGAGLALVWLGLGPWLRWRSTHFVVTADRVMFREGLVARNDMNIPLSRVASVETEVDLNDRLFGCGSLIIESNGAKPLRFTDIPHVEDVHTLLYRAVDGDLDHLPA